MSVKFGPLFCLTALALFGASGARASAVVQTASRAEIVQSAGIAVTQDLSFKAQVPTDIVLSPGSTARVRLTGATDGVSLAVPSMFDLTRAGGLETLTVNTVNTLSTLNRTVVGGALRANGALSVDVSGTVALLGVSMAPGAYHGFLVVVAQYN